MRTNISTRKKNKGYQAIISYKIPGTKEWKQKTKQGFKTVREAKTWAHEKERELQEQIAYQLNQHEGITVRRLIDLYLKTKSKTVRYNTMYNYKLSLQYLKPIYGKKVKDLRPVDMELIDLSRLAPATKSAYITTIRSLFNFAVDYLEIIPKNPARKLKAPPIPKKKAPTISIHEFKTKLQPLLEERKDVSLFFELAIRTGGRRQEIAGLTYDDVHENYVIIDKQYNKDKTGKLTFVPTKNRTKRKIPIPKSLYKDVLVYKISQPHSPDGRIFTVGTRNYSDHYKRLTKGTKYEKMTIHNFRHSFASNLIAQGIDVQTVASLIGDTFETTYRRYIHQTDEGMKAAEKLLKSI